MARRRRSSPGMRKPRKIGTEELKCQKYSGMANSGHIDAPRWGFSSSKNGKLDVCVFYARFAAKKFLDLMIEEDEVEWLNDNTLRTTMDITLRGDKLKEIFSHKLTYNENRYHKLSEDSERRTAIIRSDDYAKPFVAGESLSHRKRSSRKGMTLIKVIAEELGITPREARGILREHMKKPEQGWAWRTTEEVTKIKNILLSQIRIISVNFPRSEVT